MNNFFVWTAWHWFVVIPAALMVMGGIGLAVSAAMLATWKFTGEVKKVEGQLVRWKLLDEQEIVSLLDGQSAGRAKYRIWVRLNEKVWAASLDITWQPGRPRPELKEGDLMRVVLRRQTNSAGKERWIVYWDEKVSLVGDGVEA